MQENEKIMHHINKHKKFLIWHTFFICAATIILILLNFYRVPVEATRKNRNYNNISPVTSATPTGVATPTTNLGVSPSTSNAQTSSSLFTLSGNGAIEETGSFGEAGNNTFWLNSGAKIFVDNGNVQTIKGDLPTTDKWYTIYKGSNPVDTDSGLHPQNLIRLVSRSSWKNFTQEASFNISNINKSLSPNRNASNGVLFFSRYVDGQNLYYAGVRVDGTLVIKKKKNGSYYTMAQTKIFSSIYDINTNYNLIPKNSWFKLKLKTETMGNKVSLIFSYDDGSGAIKSIEAIDDGVSYGGASFLDSGKIGIRTDFMDLNIKNYIVTK